MILKGFVAWMFFCHQVTCRPLSTEMLKEDDQVTRCIVEVISDTLSNPRPLPVTTGCSKVLKEDERVVAMVHHQNLLRELEELAQPASGKSSVKQMPLKSDKKWNYPTEESMEWNEEDNLEKRLASLKQEGGDEWRETSVSQGGSHVKKEEGEVKRNDEGQEVKNEEQRKDKDVNNGGDDTKVGTRASKEEFSDEDKASFEKERGELSEEEYQSSIEVGQEGREDLKADELIEKVTKQELESREDEEEEERKEREGGVARRNGNGNGNGIGQPNASKRVEENASDEETDQFEAEQKGLKILEAQSHPLGNGDKQQPREDKRRHRLDTKQRREDDVVSQWKRHHGLWNSKVEAVDGGEEGEGEEGKREQEERKLKHEEHELRNLAEIERELKDVADKLRNIQRG